MALIMSCVENGPGRKVAVSLERAPVAVPAFGYMKLVILGETPRHRTWAGWGRVIPGCGGGHGRPRPAPVSLGRMALPMARDACEQCVWMGFDFCAVLGKCRITSLLLREIIIDTHPYFCPI